MRINSVKSKDMIIGFTRDSEFLNDIPSIMIWGMPVEKVDHAKLLGVTFSCDLTWNKHVENIVGKASKRLYMLYQLKRAGINQSDLVSVFLSIVRPVLEYACPVWHINLPTYLSDSIELIQKRAMKSIYPGQSYADVLQRMGLLTLNERRELLCKLYFNKIKISSHKLNHLLPEIRNIEYDIRQCNVYPLPRTRTNRYRNSLIPWGLYNCQWVDNYCILQRYVQI